jgi:hypothetical protein
VCFLWPGKIAEEFIYKYYSFIKAIMLVESGTISKNISQAF